MNLLLELRDTSSRLQKEVILSRATELEQRVFNYAYDKNKVFRIKAVGAIDLNDLGEPDVELFDILDGLVDGSYSGDEARYQVQHYAEQHGDLIKLIVRKDLDCGVTATTVNKVFPGLVPQFKVQLAKEVPLGQVDFPCLMQIKYDGVRIVIIKRDTGEVEFYTRNGKRVELPKIAEILNTTKLSSFMLDTEVTLFSGTMDDRTTVSGMINSAMHGGTIDEDLIRFNVFDAMTVEEFETTYCHRTYKNRFKQVLFILETMQSEHLIPALTMLVDTKEQANYVYEALVEQGYEGAILKSEEHLYTFKRSKDWVKLKETKTADLKCIGYEEGEGKYEGAIGALHLAGVVEGKEVLVSVGSGLTDIQRFCNPEHYMNKTIEVKYNTVIQDSATNQWSLFLPRFKWIRFDK